MFGPPFDSNAAYTYHKFWASTARDSVQSYVNFSDRYNVPLFLGETGELTDDWNSAFRRLNDRSEISWCFWTYKNLDSSSTVMSIPKPAGWDAITVLGNQPAEDWRKSSVPADAAATLSAYLEAIKFKNDHVNGSYLASLGMTTPTPAATPPGGSTVSLGQK